ncbi:MAG: methyltransferase type 11 [Omnitrophica bacterium GWA2_52_8]|nr:MAG: methyltransferase type 11 [Omnitrophica bacterium GWA2_52_8]
MKSTKAANTFSENDIRPAHLIDEQAALKLCDVGRLLLRRKEFVEVPCPACEEARFKKTYQKYGLDYVTCAQCATLYISPRPSPDVLEQMYRESEVYAYWNKFIYPASEEKRRAKMYVPRVDRLLSFCDKFNVRKDSVLEIGAAFGTFCEELKSRNYFKRIVGLEQTPDLAAACRKKGFEVIESPLEKVSLKNAFNVVASFEVIEHVFSPRGFVASCRELLTPGGILLLTCPNGKGFDVQMLGTLSKTVCYEHLNYFNPESLELLLKKEGFSVLETATPGQLDAELVRNKVIDGELDVSGQPFIRQILIERWEEAGAKFQEFLAAHKLSSHLWIVARKN